MSKSTPISQLPAMSPSPQFNITDQQKNMINDAQFAIQNSSMPQNTSSSTDIINDSDVAIREVLNSIREETEDPAATRPQPQLQPQHVTEKSNEDVLIARQVLQQLNNQKANQAAANPIANQQALIDALMMNNSPIADSFNIKNMILSCADDIKLACIVFVSVFLAHFLPVHKLLEKYVDMTRIPHSKVVLRATVAAAIVVVTKKFVIKI